MKLLSHKQGAAAEKRVAKMLNGRTRPASGARWFAKGDVSTSTQLVQVKSTRKKQFTLKLVDLQAIERQASGENRDAALVVEFNTPQGNFHYRIERQYA